MSDYSPPVNQLLTYSEPNGTDYRFESWPDYVQEFGFTTDHVPDLIRLMTDKTYWEWDSEQDDVWAPYHAWRALAQLKALEAVAPLLDLFEDYEDDDYLIEEATEVLAAIGPEVLPIVEPYLYRDDFSAWGKISIVLGLIKIGEQHPESQQTCIDILRHQLEDFQNNDEGLNGWLVDGLVRFNVTDAAPLIERVYTEGDIDDMCAGTWPYVQVSLGLKKESDFTEEDMLPEMTRNLQAKMSDMEALGQVFGQREPSSFGMRPLLNRNVTSAPAKFGEGSLKAPKSATPKPSQGFGQNMSSQKSNKKKKKK